MIRGDSRPLPPLIGGERRILFVSDVHLRYKDEPYLGQFLGFLDFAESRRADVFILGDLFEFWSGPAQARLPFYRPLFERLARLTGSGIRVNLIHGNRDFLIGKAFERAGVVLVKDEATLRLNGRTVHVSHGDRFCVEDRSYQRARFAMRSWPVRALAAVLPAAVGLFLARRYRKISARKLGRMKSENDGRLSTILRGAAAEFEKGHDVIVCGHIHDFRETPMDVQGRRRRLLTMGAWEDGPNYVEFDGDDVVLRRFDQDADPPSGLRGAHSQTAPPPGVS